MTVFASLTAYLSTLFTAEKDKIKAALPALHDDFDTALTETWGEQKDDIALKAEQLVAANEVTGSTGEAKKAAAMTALEQFVVSLGLNFTRQLASTLIEMAVTRMNRYKKLPTT